MKIKELLLLLQVGSVPGAVVDAMVGTCNYIYHKLKASTVFQVGLNELHISA